MTCRILVADPIAPDGVAILERAGTVDVCTGQSAEQLIARIGGYDALVVRSETKVTAAVIEAGARLQIIGRAGVGVDNIDLDAATLHGIVVVNAPTGNTISAAEHTIGLMLALARHIPRADASLRRGEWKRSDFVGVELRGKTLGIVGLGQVGSEVARRAAGLAMRVIAFDPFVSEERARALGVEAAPFERVLAEADFLTVHTTLTSGTKGLIGAEELRRMKPGVRLINTARGGIIDEAALLDAVKSGHVAGAAIDVFVKEPAPDTILAQDERIVVTPHLGASTSEAQERVAIDVAEQIVGVLGGEPAAYAVNAPMIAPETLSALRPFAEAAVMAGSLATQLSSGQLGAVEIAYTGELSLHDTGLLRAGVIRGLLKPVSEENVTIVNADLVAQHRGLRITERKDPHGADGGSQVAVRVTTSTGATDVAATVEHGEPHIAMLDGMHVDVSPASHNLLILDNQDIPGMIGRVGTLMGEFDINIASMHVGRHRARGRAVMVLQLDEAPTEAQIRRIESIPNVFSARLVRL
ncbi:MAG TPA: phosphoglycerate dehydrogenase [Dehalococcoidia bacterium]|nr:phosphoglycerate dehydrogenase [Dehalococcoidia bacterium]